MAERGLSTRKCLAYGDLVVIDISRNLLLIISNVRYVVINIEFRCLQEDKYPARSRRGRIYILNGFNKLRVISF